MNSIWENSFIFRLFVLICWVIFIFLLNYVIFAPFFLLPLNINYFIVFVSILIILYFMLQNFKYKYKIDDKLIIKTPKKKYEIPFNDILEVKKIHDIWILNKLFIKFDANQNIMYLNWFCSKGILIKLNTHSLVISPIKYDVFFKRLQNI